MELENKLVGKLEGLMEKWSDCDFTESKQCQVYGDPCNGDHWLSMNVMWLMEDYHKTLRIRAKGMRPTGIIE